MPQCRPRIVPTSTAAAITDISGRGVGMDVVKKNIEKLGGSVAINSEEGKVTYNGLEIELHGKVFEVLAYLARHRDQIVTKEQLLDAVKAKIC